MRFLLDESAEFRLLGFLQTAEHDVTAIVAHHRQALDDVMVLRIARAEGRVLITNDTDFGDLVYRQRMPHAGVILFRLADASVDQKIEGLRKLLASGEGLVGQFVVIGRRGHRIRNPAEGPPPPG